MNDYVKDFIENKIYLLDKNDFEEFYECWRKSLTFGKAQYTKDFAEIFYSSGIDPLIHMSYIPNSFLTRSSITSFNIPDNIKSIGYKAFSESNLKSIVLPKNITAIASAVFQNCNYLEQADIQAQITCIPTRTFYGCKNLRNVQLNNNIDTIELECFRHCSIENINIPASCMYITDRAFADNSSNVLQITYNGKRSEWRGIKKGKNIFLNTNYVIHCLDGDIYKKV